MPWRPLHEYQVIQYRSNYFIGGEIPDSKTCEILFEAVPALFFLETFEPFVFPSKKRGVGANRKTRRVEKFKIFLQPTHANLASQSNSYKSLSLVLWQMAHSCDRKGNLTFIIWAQMWNLTYGVKFACQRKKIHLINPRYIQLTSLHDRLWSKTARRFSLLTRCQLKLALQIARFPLAREMWLQTFRSCPVCGVFSRGLFFWRHSSDSWMTAWVTFSIFSVEVFIWSPSIFDGVLGC